MQLNTIRLQRLVRMWLIVAIVCASVLAAAFYYFYFTLLDQEATLLGRSRDSVQVRDTIGAEDVADAARRLEEKQRLTAIRAEDVTDAFSPDRVPSRR